MHVMNTHDLDNALTRSTRAIFALAACLNIAARDAQAIAITVVDGLAYGAWSPAAAAAFIASAGRVHVTDVYAELLEAHLAANAVIRLQRAARDT